MTYSGEIIDVEVDLHRCERQGCAPEGLMKQRSVGQTAFYRRDENKQLCCIVLFDMVEDVAKKPGGSARHINDSSASYYKYFVVRLQGAAGARPGCLQAWTQNVPGVKRLCGKTGQSIAPLSPHPPGNRAN